MYLDILFIFLKSVFVNKQAIFLICLFFLLTSFVGISIAFKVIKNNFWLSITAGCVGGVFGFILFLGTLGHFFKDRTGILIMLTLYVLMGLFFLLKSKINFSFKITRKMLISIFFTLVICVWFLLLFFVTAGNNTYGGDVIAYWGFATSFANGNYPVYSLWQPDILAAHHQGAYLYEGAIYAVTNTNIRLIHSLFSFFVVSAGFFLLWALVASQIKMKKTGLLVVMIFYISFAGVFIILPKSFSPLLYPEVTHQIDRLPIMTDAKNRLGGSSNLNELFYINHRAAAFGGMFLIITILLVPLSVTVKWRLILVSLLIIPIVSSDEVVLPTLGLIGFGWWISYLLKHSKIENIVFLKYSLYSLVIIILAFFIIGSALRDALLIPTDEPRFHLLTKSSDIIQRLKSYQSVVLEYKSSPVIFAIPHMFMMILVGGYIAWYKKNLFIMLLLLGVVGSIIGVLFTEHTFYPGNFGRFLHLGYLLTAVALAVGLLMLIDDKNRFIKYGAIVLFIILFIPGLISSQFYLLKAAVANEYPNFNSVQPDYPVLKWIQKNIAEKRVFFIDGYLKGKTYSYLTTTGIESYGLFIPVSPAFIKVHTPDFGFEAIDVINTLDPESIADLKIDYLYLVNEYVSSFPPKRQLDILNREFFRPVYTDKEGVLYQITDNYKQLTDIQGDRLRDLKNLIKEDAAVYLESPPVIPMNLRSPILLALQDKGTVYTLQSSGTFNYIEKRLQFKNPQPGIKYTQLFLDAKTDPFLICSCKTTKIWDIGEVKGYQVHE